MSTKFLDIMCGYQHHVTNMLIKWLLLNRFKKCQLSLKTGTVIYHLLLFKWQERSSAMGNSQPVIFSSLYQTTTDEDNDIIHNFREFYTKLAHQATWLVNSLKVNSLKCNYNIPFFKCVIPHEILFVLITSICYAHPLWRQSSWFFWNVRWAFSKTSHSQIHWMRDTPLEMRLNKFLAYVNQRWFNNVVIRVLIYAILRTRDYLKIQIILTY